MPSSCRWFRVLIHVEKPEFLHALEIHDLRSDTQIIYRAKTRKRSLIWGRWLEGLEVVAAPILLLGRELLSDQELLGQADGCWPKAGQLSAMGRDEGTAVLAALLRSGWVVVYSYEHGEEIAFSTNFKDYIGWKVTEKVMVSLEFNITC
ncbi:hypothetical protein E3N88_24346 [Mikania micrantha]|uniref:Uncharacterized protein n=1 Tax=Mikania micrantha TaxID=192012 RepID=A0A5N6N4J9_9ASTR|nr:hypothetical protein E3N88_24346 [Mikania micrantha]